MMQGIVVSSLVANDRLQAASEFLRSFPGREVLLVSATRTAADVLLRNICAETASVFGVCRFTVPQLAIERATTRLAQDGKTVLARCRNRCARRARRPLVP